MCYDSCKLTTCRLVSPSKTFQVFIYISSNLPEFSTEKYVKFSGRLKMQDRKMTDNNINRRIMQRGAL